MGMANGFITEDTRKTLAELAAESGGKYDTLYRKAKRKFPAVAWTASTEVPADIAAALVGNKPGKKTGKTFSRPAGREKKNAISSHTPAPADEPAPMPPGRAKFALPEWATVRRFLFETLAVCIVIGHGYMIWQEAAEIYGYIGNIGGAVIFAIVCLAVLIAADSSRNRTSWFALLFMVFVDFAAGFVHYEALRTPVVPEAMTIGFCIFICASSFVALLLFRDSKLD